MSNDFKINNPSANQVLVYSEIQKAFINVEPSGTNTGAIEGGVNLGGGEAIFNDVQGENLRFKTLTSNNGIEITNKGSSIEISFDGEATTLGGLSKNDYLHADKNLLDVDAQEARKNLKVYSKKEADDNFLEANATNIPDIDNRYDLGSNGRRFADIFAVTFRGTATNASLAQDLEQKGATDGQVLTWDNNEKEWLPKDASSTRLRDLVDVDTDNLDNESVLLYNGSRSKWEVVPLSSIGAGESGGGSGGTVTDAENVGSGLGVFFTRFGGNLQFRSVTGGNNVTVESNFNNEEIVINADVPLSSDDLSEGDNNLYYTDQRVLDVFSVMSIQDLGNMPSIGPSSDQAPVWNGSEWEFRDVASNINTTDDLPEGLSNQYFTQNKAFDAIDEYLVDGTHGIRLQDLKDTNVSLDSGTFLYNDGTRWVNREVQMSDLGDVSLTGLANGSSLVYNSTSGRFEMGVMASRLIDLQETSDSLHFSQESFDDFFNNKDADDLAESASRKFLNTANLRNTMGTVSIGALQDVDITNIANNSVLVWDSGQGSFVTADSSNLDVTVDMGLGDLNNVNESSVTNAQDGYVLTYNSVNSEFEIVDGTQALTGLSDVQADTIQSGQGLVYSSGSFVPMSLVPFDGTVAASDGSILQYNASKQKYEAVTASGFGVSALNDLDDVTLTSLSNDDVMVYDNTLGDFVNRAVSDVVTIENIGGVEVSSPQTNDALIFDGVNFVNVAYPNFDLTGMTDNDIVQYDQTSGQFESVSPFEALNINYSAPSNGDSFIYNSSTGKFDVRQTAIDDLSDVNDFAGTKTDGNTYALVWDDAGSAYDLLDLSTTFTLESLANVTESDVSDGATVRYNGSNGLYEIRKSSIGDNSDVNLATIEDGSALVWSSTDGEFVKGIPVIDLEELANVGNFQPQDGEGILWSESLGEYTNVKLDVSYDEVVRTSGALEFWNFDNTLTGALSSIDLSPSTGYDEYSVSSVGLKGSPSAQSGTTYDPNTETEAKKLTADVAAMSLTDAESLSFDVWVHPSNSVVYNTAEKDPTTIAAMGVRADTANETILTKIMIQPTAEGHEYRIAIEKDRTVLGSVAIDLNPDSYNYVAANYIKNATSTDVVYQVNGVQYPTLTVNSVISDDNANTMIVEALQELETGSQAYRVDNMSVYLDAQSSDLIERKFKNVVSNGFTYSVPSIFGLRSVNIANIADGDVLRYNGTEFVNAQDITKLSDLEDVDVEVIAPGQVLEWTGTVFSPTTINHVETLSELNDVDTSGVVSGQHLEYNGSQFVPVTLDIPSAIEDLSNVDITGISSGQVLEWDGSQFSPVALNIPSAIEDLSNVDITGISNGQVLEWDGTQFVPATVSGGSGATQMSELSDVDNALAPTDGQVLVFNSTSGVFEAGNVSGGSGATQMSELSDVDSALAPTDGQVLQYNNANARFESVTLDFGAATNMGDLANVNDTGISNGQVLQWDGSNYVPHTITDNTGATQMNELSDVTITSPVTGQFVRHNGTEFVNETVSIPVSASDLSDIDTTGVTDGQVLIYNTTSGAFEAGTVSGGGASQLNDLNDVTLNGTSDGEILTWDNASSQWINQTLSEAGISSDSHNHDAEYATTSHNHAFANLSDVTMTSPINYSLLSYDAFDEVWRNRTIEDAGVARVNHNHDSDYAAVNHAHSFDSLSDVTITAPTNGEMIRFNGSQFVNEAVTIPTSASDLSDIDTTGVTDGQVLVYNATSGAFEAGTVSGGGASQLNDLSDVTLSGTSDGEILTWDSVSSQWINQTLSEAGISSDSHNHDAEYLGINDKAVDAESLDGLDSTQFLRSDTSDTLNGVLTVDNPNTVTHGIIIDTPDATTGSGNVVLGIKARTPTEVQWSIDTYDHPSANNTVTFYSAYDMRIDAFEQLDIWAWGREQIKVNSDSTMDIITNTLNVQGGTNGIVDVRGSNARVDVISSNDANESTVNIHGSNQGTGRLYVGSSELYGGGIEYNGDGTPATTNAGSDFTTLWRRNNGTDEWTARNHVNNNDWEFRANVKAATFEGDGSGLTNVNAETLDGQDSTAFATATHNHDADYADINHVHDLNSLSDVTITTPATGEFVRYNGTEFVNEAVSIPASASDLSDIDTSGVEDGQVLIYNSVSGAFEAGTISGGGASNLSDLNDVDTTGVADGQVLAYDNATSEFKPINLPAGGGAANYEWVEFLYSSGSGGTLGAPDSLQRKTDNVNVTIADGPNGIIQFSFTGKKYPPISIWSYGQATSSNEFLMNSIYNYGTHITSSGGTIEDPSLFSGNYDGTITLELTMATTGSSAGFGERAHMYIMFAFAE